MAQGKRIFTNRTFHTADITEDVGRITWYTLQKQLPRMYSSILLVEFLETTSSAGDWSGLLYQSVGKSVHVIPFSQTNTHYGFSLETGDTIAVLPKRNWRELKTEIKKDYAYNS